MERWLALNGTGVGVYVLVLLYVLVRVEWARWWGLGEGGGVVGDVGVWLGAVEVLVRCYQLGYLRFQARKLRF